MIPFYNQKTNKISFIINHAFLCTRRYFYLIQLWTLTSTIPLKIGVSLILTKKLRRSFLKYNRLPEPKHQKTFITVTFLKFRADYPPSWLHEKKWTVSSSRIPTKRSPSSLTFWLCWRCLICTFSHNLVWKICDKWS